MNTHSSVLLDYGFIRSKMNESGVVTRAKCPLIRMRKMTEEDGRRQHQAGDYPGHHQFIYLKPVKTEIKQGRSYVSFRKIFKKGTKDRPFILPLSFYKGLKME